MTLVRLNRNVWEMTRTTTATATATMMLLLLLLILLSIVHGFETCSSLFMRPSSVWQRRTTTESCLFTSSSSDNTFVRQQSFIDFTQRLAVEGEEIMKCASIALSPIFGKDRDQLATPEGIVKICDLIDAAERQFASSSSSSSSSVAAQTSTAASETIQDGQEDAGGSSTSATQQPPQQIAWVSSTSSLFPLRTKALEFQRYESLVNMMKANYTTYVATASFLSPSRIPRRQLPNVQDIPLLDAQTPASKSAAAAAAATTLVDEETGLPLVADCELDAVEFKDTLLDKVLLSIFRDLVRKNTGGVTSSKHGIDGLLDQARTYMLQKDQTPEAQHKMVRETLGGLMTPVLPPFYRIFMSGIIPKSIGGDEWGGKQVGPWFYAPFLTAFVTPTFFQFLVGPSHTNRRKDGQPGGLVVEKCKFLQESGCKGMCLNICKIPAQQFFKDGLGLDLTVSPNFVTQECQWSFGESPLPADEDPSFPKGCLVGCESRKALVASGSKADLCN